MFFGWSNWDHQKIQEIRLSEYISHTESVAGQATHPIKLTHGLTEILGALSVLDSIFEKAYPFNHVHLFIPLT
jgi:hypothetical protein